MRSAAHFQRRLSSRSGFPLRGWNYFAFGLSLLAMLGSLPSLAKMIQVSNAQTVEASDIGESESEVPSEDPTNDAGSVGVVASRSRSRLSRIPVTALQLALMKETGEARTAGERRFGCERTASRRCAGHAVQLPLRC
jgi:hypothetical protein